MFLETSFPRVAWRRRCQGNIITFCGRWTRSPRPAG